MTNKFNKEGEPIDSMTWLKLLEEKDYKIIRQETLPNKKIVSTIWLGLDHSFGQGEPLIFETMVFKEKGNYTEEACQRYSTLKQAQAGHRKMVEEYN